MSLNETNIVVQEGDDNSTTVYICVVLADAMGGLQRDIVVDLTVMSVTANSKSTMIYAVSKLHVVCAAAK